MEISVSSSGTGLKKMIERYSKMQGSIDDNLVTALTPVKNSGVIRIKEATPVDSGKTRDSWGGTIKKVPVGVDIILTNDNKTKTDIPIPILIRNGHITGTGGYVPPNDFMTPVVKSLVRDASRKVKEVIDNG